MDWTTGLDYWTVWAEHTLQYFYLGLLNRSSSFLGLGLGFLNSQLSIDDLDDSENISIL